MPNVNDYLRWRGDLTFDERPFNDADNIVLSTMVYLDFSDVVPDWESGDEIPLSTACRRLVALSRGDVNPFVRSFSKVSTDFVELLANTRRFGEARLSAYVDVLDKDRSLQFSAVCVKLPNNDVYIAFRGTDGTLVGWREDFMLGFQVTEAQREAVRYLERAVEAMPPYAGVVRVGGHSKGGNLAEYAAVCASPEVRERIVQVYSNDGPGLAPEVVADELRPTLDGRIRRIVPAFSVVGMLFARAGDVRHIVLSSGVGIRQHDPTTWQLTYDGLDEVSALQPECVALNRTISGWFDDLSLEERARLTDEVFDALEAGGAKRFDQLASSPESLQQVLVALAMTDERTRDLALALLQGALITGTVSTSVDVVRKLAKRLFAR